MNANRKGQHQSMSKAASFASTSLLPPRGSTALPEDGEGAVLVFQEYNRTGYDLNVEWLGTRALPRNNSAPTSQREGHDGAISWHPALRDGLPIALVWLVQVYLVRRTTPSRMRRFRSRVSAAMASLRLLLGRAAVALHSCSRYKASMTLGRSKRT